MSFERYTFGIVLIFQIFTLNLYFLRQTLADLNSGYIYCSTVHKLIFVFKLCNIVHVLRNKTGFDFLQITKMHQRSIFQPVSNRTVSIVKQSTVRKRSTNDDKIVVRNLGANKPFVNCYFSPINCRLPSKPVHVDLSKFN